MPRSKIISSQFKGAGSGARAKIPDSQIKGPGSGARAKIAQDQIVGGYTWGETFPQWQLNAQWNLVPYAVRATRGAGLEVAQVEMDTGNNGLWRPDPAGTSIPMTTNYTGGTDGISAHANIVLSYLTSCASNLSRIHAYAAWNWYPSVIDGWDSGLWSASGSPTLPAGIITPPPVVLVNHSYNATIGSISMMIGSARLARYMKTQGVLDVVTMNNGGGFAPMPGLKGESLSVGTNDDGSASAQTYSDGALSAYTDLQLASGPKVILDGCGYSSYAAPALDSMMLCLKSYFGSGKTMAQIEAAVLATKHSTTKHVRMKDAYDLLASS
jgi:hypothetical protein